MNHTSYWETPQITKGGCTSATYLSVTMRIGICVPATQNVMNTRSIRNGSRVWHVDLHGPLVAIGDIITSDDMWELRIQEHPVKF